MGKWKQIWGPAPSLKNYELTTYHFGDGHTRQSVALVLTPKQTATNEYTETHT